MHCGVNIANAETGAHYWALWEHILRNKVKVRDTAAQNKPSPISPSRTRNTDAHKIRVANCPQSATLALEPVPRAGEGSWVRQSLL